MLTSIDVKFIFDSARLALFSSANILHIAVLESNGLWYFSQMHKIAAAFSI